DGDQVESDPRAAQTFCPCLDVAVLEADLGAHLLQALDVLVDGAGADGAATGQRDASLAVARHERTEGQHARPPRLDELVWGDRLEFRGRRNVDLDRPARAPFDVAAHGPQQPGHGADIGQVGDVPEGVGALREEARGEAGKGGVLRAGDPDGADEPVASADDDGVHGPEPNESRYVQATT